MMDNVNIYDIPISSADRVMNRFVRIALKMRKSKPLFACADVAERYLDSLKGRQDEYVPVLDYKCNSELTDICGLKCVVLTGQRASNKLIIYLAGGAFVREAVPQHRRLVQELCLSTDAKVVVPIYPKAPTHTYEITNKLLIRLYDKLLNEYNPKNIIIIGDSAGGTIALTMMHLLKSECLPKPSRLILFSPMLDITLINENIIPRIPKDPMHGVDGLGLFVKAWAGETDMLSPLVNPISCEFGDLPETVIYSGTDELLIFDAELFCKRAAENGRSDIKLYRYEGMYHDFVLYPLRAAGKVKKETIKLINT